VNVVDLVVAVLVVASAVHGLFVGAAIQITSYAGLWGGLVLGAALAPLVSKFGSSPLSRSMWALAAFVIATAALTTVARILGIRIWHRVHRAGLGRLDSVAGAVVSAVATLLAAWLAASVVVRLPAPRLTAQIQHSKILRALDDVLPAPPKVFARLGRLFDPLGFPNVFAQFEPDPAPSLPLPADPVVRAALAAAGASTVRIEGIGCGQIQEGSGFVVASGLVVTNAHVVAGVRSPVVLDRAGSHPAQALVFDPKMDVAVLRTRGLGGRPLPMLATAVARGDQDAVLGYPGGGPLKVGAAVVLSEVTAIGRDIYNRSLSTRDVYELRADIRPGNSGGPVVHPDGTVVGVVFARSTINSGLGFALTAPEVRARVQAAETSTAPTSTGPCAA
jgi:S1-C subfamily serine protease